VALENPKLPDSVLCKILRAKQHYDALISELTGCLQGTSAKVVLEANPQTNTVRVIRTEGPAIPPVVSLIIGDVLQNLRSSLDYLVWELVLAAKNEPTIRNAFPICLTPTVSRML
jgi:hypothetical protein